MKKDLTILRKSRRPGSQKPGALRSTESLSSARYINDSLALSPTVKKPSSSRRLAEGRAEGGKVAYWRRVATPGHATVGVVVTLLVLAAIVLPFIGPVEANTGCPESTSSFGNQTFIGTCTITSATTWENGVLTIAGDVVVEAPLTLRNVVVAFDPSFGEEYGLFIAASFDMQGGGIQSTNSNHWKVLSYSGSVAIRDGTFNRGTWDLRNSPGTLENNTFENTDARQALDGQHMWIGPNSTVSHNTFTGIQVDDGAVMVSRMNWGNIQFFGNAIGYNCMPPSALSNCMGIEVISSQVEHTPIAPFPAVEIAWNNFTFESIAANTDSNAVDIEFSDRVYVHNNTMRVIHATQLDAITELLLSGGARDSVFENNTGYGKPQPGDVYTYCFFQFIYQDSNNRWQYNACDDLERMVILSGTGSAVFAHNSMTNISSTGFWICDFCAGGSPGAGSDLIFYNNSFTRLSGTDIIWNDIVLVDSNTYILNGNGQTTQWGEGTGPPDHTVPGDGNWLYHAQSSIEELRFANESDSDRRVTMTANGGNQYWDVYPDFGAADNAALTVTGNIDPSGSLNINDDGSGTFLWKLGRDKADIDVLAIGDVTFGVENFFIDTSYDVRVDGSLALSFNTDAAGGGSFVFNFASQHRVVIEVTGAAPPDSTPPTASFVFSPGAPIVGENITFDASSSADDTGVVSYAWDFGNGDAAQGQIVTYAYSSDGGYNVTLTVLDAAGNSDTTVSSLQVAAPPDEIPPAKVTDLAAVVVNSRYVILQWRAPGDDGGVGNAASYDIRFNTTGPLDDTNFNSAAQVPVSVPVPAAPGSTERLNVSGLTPETDYWFALRTTDEVSNWSPVSNSVNTTTLQNSSNVDDTPPSVTVTSPQQDDVISGTVIVAVEAFDDTNVDAVVILLDGSLATTLIEPPYLWAWSTDTVSPGFHTLRAEAVDPTGNVGSHEIRVIVLPPGITPEPTPPGVVSLMHDPVARRFDIQFSEPMDRASVNQALRFNPGIAHLATWQDDSNLTIVLQEDPVPSILYTLTIDRTAANAKGTPLAEDFSFGFIRIGGMGDLGVSPNMWLPLSLLLAAGLITVAGLHLWSRRGTRQIRQNMRQLALRLEELNSASQARIYRELAELENLISKSVPVGEGGSKHLTRAR